MQLTSLLDDVPPRCTLWVSSQERNFSCSEVLSWIASCRESLHSLERRKVAIHAQRELDLAIILLTLDGFVSELTILPPTVELETSANIAVETGCDVILSCEESCVLTRTDVPRIQFFDLLEPAPSKNDDGLRRCLPSVESTRWLLPTSGTTGQPKLVSHTVSSLTRSAKSDRTRGANFTWGSLYSLGSFAGLQVFLQSLISGSRFVFLPRDATLTDKIRRLSESGCNALSATPTMWRMILMTEAVKGLELSQITLGGEVVDQAILDALTAQFPKARMTHIYASTEAGVGFVVRDGREGFPVHFAGHSVDGVNIRVADDGTLRIKPASIEQQYADDDRPLVDSDGFIETGDIVERCGDRFVFCGRKSGVINVGGNKVHPQEVESILLRHPDVLLAKVSARKNPFTGSLVEAQAVLHSDSRLSETEAQRVLTDFCRSHLKSYKVPAIIEVVESVSISANGKLSR